MVVSQIHRPIDLLLDVVSVRTVSERVRSGGIVPLLLQSSDARDRSSQRSCRGGPRAGDSRRSELTKHGGVCFESEGGYKMKARGKGLEGHHRQSQAKEVRLFCLFWCRVSVEYDQN